MSGRSFGLKDFYRDALEHAGADLACNIM